MSPATWNFKNRMLLMVVPRGWGGGLVLGRIGWLWPVYFGTPLTDTLSVLPLSLGTDFRQGLVCTAHAFFASQIWYMNENIQVCCQQDDKVKMTRSKWFFFLKIALVAIPNVQPLSPRALDYEVQFPLPPSLAGVLGQELDLVNDLVERVWRMVGPLFAGLRGCKATPSFDGQASAMSLIWSLTPF